VQPGKYVPLPPLPELTQHNPACFTL